jgi:hypothetical protein
MAKKRDEKSRERKKRRERLRRMAEHKASANPLAKFGINLPPNAKVIHNVPGMPKMSEQLPAFLEPYESSATSREDYEKLLTVGMTAWNLALMKAEERPEYLAPFLEVFGGNDTPSGRFFQELIAALIQRKETDPRFAGDGRFIANFVVSGSGARGHLEVVSLMPGEEA